MASSRPIISARRAVQSGISVRVAAPLAITALVSLAVPVAIATLEPIADAAPKPLAVPSLPNNAADALRLCAARIAVIFAVSSKGTNGTVFPGSCAGSTGGAKIPSSFFRSSDIEPVSSESITPKVAVHRPIFQKARFASAGPEGDARESARSSHDMQLDASAFLQITEHAE